jgi:hypothetical protein
MEDAGDVPGQSGRMLANVAFGTISPPHGSEYGALAEAGRIFPLPSVLAGNRDAQDRLW